MKLKSLALTLAVCTSLFSLPAYAAPTTYEWTTPPPQASEPATFTPAELQDIKGYLNHHDTTDDTWYFDVTDVTVQDGRLCLDVTLHPNDPIAIMSPMGRVDNHHIWSLFQAWSHRFTTLQEQGYLPRTTAATYIKVTLHASTLYVAAEPNTPPTPYTFSFVMSWQGLPEPAPVSD